MANFYRKAKKFEKAINLYTKILDTETNPQVRSDLLYRRGSSYERIKNFEKADNDLLIYDESDASLFEDPEKFDQFTGNNQCICYTATPGGSNINLEKQLI